MDTHAYFGDPIYVYSLKQGINDGFLTPFKVKQISTTLDDYVYTPDDRVIEGDVEPGKRYGKLDREKLTPLLRLQYRDSIADALADLGRKEELRDVFAGFQKYLYLEEAVA